MAFTSVGKASEEAVDMMGEILEAEPLDLGGIACAATLQGLDHGVDDLLLRVGIDETADAPIGKRIDAAVAVAGDHGQAGGCRLEEDNAEAFAGARHGERAGGC